MNLKELAPKATNRINKVMESRFGFAIDYNNLTVPKAQRLKFALEESLNGIRKSYGIHTAQTNPKYMEMLMVQEGLTAWLAENTPLMEGELETAEAVLAAKDMVDSVQDMITAASKMMNEELPPLLDTIRDQLGAAQADQFKNVAQSALQGLMDSLNGARDALDQGSRALAGEQMPQPMDLGSPELAGDELPTEPESNEFDSDEDEFAATDAATGGSEELGRERR